jgi:hypothetical protein
MNTGGGACPCGPCCSDVRLFFYPQPARLNPAVRQPVERFLGSIIDEGTVSMPPEVYREAGSWTVVTSCHGRILGFAAHRTLPTARRSLRVVQVMATFLDRSLRGGLFAPLLIHGWAFLSARGLAPGRRLYWCTRTRNPAAYAAARAFHHVLPRLNDPTANSQSSALAEQLARAAYGPQVSLDPDTFVLRDSYPSGSRFLPLETRPARPASPLRRAFAQLDYSGNETLFLLARVPYYALLLLFLLHRLRMSLRSRMRRPLGARRPFGPEPTMGSAYRSR